MTIYKQKIMNIGYLIFKKVQFEPKKVQFEPTVLTNMNWDDINILTIEFMRK